MLISKSNFYKGGGVACIIILKEIFKMVFTGKNLYRTLILNPEDIAFKKNTFYRFLNNTHYNWTRLLLLLVTTVIQQMNALTSTDRVNVLIVDDSTYDRGRSKKVELLARVFDHTTHRFVKGFKMLTLGWSDGSTFLPVSFSLLTTRHEKKLISPMQENIDKRTVGYRKRAEAMENATDVLFKLIDSAKGLPAKYLLFDSWFAFPKTIAGVVKRNIDVICMIKSTSKIHYFYQGEWLNIKEIYKKLSCTPKENILGSVTVCIRESKKNLELIDVKIVFVKDRHSSNWLALLSTDVFVPDEEIIRIYGKRWDIEVFFKMTKSFLALAKEFQGRSYDMMTAHTSIVFMRYIMLAIESRYSKDQRSIGQLYYDLCEEIADIKVDRAVFLILDALKAALNQNPIISQTAANLLMEQFFKELPSVWADKLQLCA